MIALIILACVVGYILFVLYQNEGDTYNTNADISLFKIFIKIVYRLIKFRKQGVIHIDKSLVYVAGGTGVNADCSLIISPRNHKTKVNKIRIDKENLRLYKQLCGYNVGSSVVPVCYAETLFFKLLVDACMSDKFCLCPIGLIHKTMKFEQIRPLENYMDDDLSMEVEVSQYRQMERGVECDIDQRLLTTSGFCLWSGTITLFSRGSAARSGGNRTAHETEEEEDYYSMSSDVFVPADCGLNYAKLTGDVNPHHLWSWSAWIVGFKAPIAHGMWTLSRALGLLQQKDSCLDSERLKISCGFKRPLFMPGTVTVKYDDPNSRRSAVCRLRVEDMKTMVPHLTATIKQC